MSSIGNGSGQLVQAVSLLNGQDFKKERGSRAVEAIEQASRIIAGYDGNILKAITPEEFTALINNLGRAFSLIKCDAVLFAMCQIAQLMAHGKLTDWESRAAIALVNELSKVIKIPNFNCQRVHRAMDHVAVTILSSNLENFESQQLFDLLDGLSQVSAEAGYQDVYEAKGHITAYLLQRDLQDCRPQQLAKLIIHHFIINILRSDSTKVDLVDKFREKAEKIDCEGGLRDIDYIVVRALRGKLGGFESILTGPILNLAANYILQRDLADFEPQPLADLLNGFGKVLEIPGSDCQRVREAMDHLAVHIILQRDLADFEPQLLADLLNILQRDLADFEPQLLADLLNGFGKVLEIPGSDCQRVREAMDHLAVHILQGNFADKTILGFIINYVLQRNLAEFKPQQLVNLLNGLSNVVENPNFADLKMRGVMDYAVMELLQRNLINFGLEQLTKSAVDYIAKTILQRDLTNFELPQLANLFHIFSQESAIANRVEVPEVMIRLVEPLSQRDWTNYESQQLAKLVVGLRKAIGIDNSVFLSALESHFASSNVISLSYLADVEPRELSKLVVVHTAKYILQRGLENCEPQTLANVVKSFNKVVGKIDCGPWVRPMDCVVAHLLQYKDIKSLPQAMNLSVKYILQRNLADVELPQLTALVKGLSQVARMEDCEDEVAAMDRIAKYIVTIPRGDLKKFDSRQLAELLHSFGQVVGRRACKQVSRAMAHIAGHVLQRKWSNFSIQELASVVDGFSGAMTEVEGSKRMRDALDSLAGNILSRGDWAGNSGPELSRLVQGLIKIFNRIGSQNLLAAVNHIAVGLREPGFPIKLDAFGSQRTRKRLKSLVCCTGVDNISLREGNNFSNYLVQKLVATAEGGRAGIVRRRSEGSYYDNGPFIRGV